MLHFPFAPTTTLDYANFLVGALTALATLATVFISVAIALLSRKDAKEAGAREEEATARTIATAQAASVRISETERELESQRRREREQLQTEQKASRQAVLVRLDGEWISGGDGQTAGMVSKVVNLSDNQISNVSVQWMANGTEGLYDLSLQRFGDVPGYREGEGEEVGANTVVRNHGWPEGEPHGSPLAFRMRFTDTFLDEWELHHPSRSLILLTPRPISSKSAPE